MRARLLVINKVSAGRNNAGGPEAVVSRAQPGRYCRLYRRIGAGPGRLPVRLYFDQNSGLLVRLVRFAETPVGRNPTQIDYADYRDADGVKIPFRWTLSRPNARFTIQIAEAKSNAPVDDGRFAKPAGEVK